MKTLIIVSALISTIPSALLAQTQLWAPGGSVGNVSGSNVGIGTSTPGATLHVNGGGATLAVTDSNTAGGAVRLGNTNGSSGQWAYDGSATTYFDFAQTFRVRSLTGGTNERLTVLSNGNVGIGTASPSFKFDLKTGTDERFLIRRGADWGGSNSGIAIDARNDAESASIPLRIRASVISLDANVGIGTTNPSHKLSVNGTVRAMEVIVDTGWSDYVFGSNYVLAPLSEVEAHIKTHQHLPGLPSSGEVKENGVSLGEMQAMLLAKIEELTLHAIEQEKRMHRLEAANEALQEVVKSTSKQ